MNRIEELRNRYLEGKSTLEEEKELRALLNEVDISEDEINLKLEFELYDQVRNSKVEETLEKNLISSLKQGKTWSDSSRWIVRIAAAIVFLFMGFLMGLIFITHKESRNQLSQLQEDVRKLQRISTEVLLKQESAQERLKAMVLASTLSQRPDSVTLKLILQAFNSDENINIRLSAFSFLTNYINDPAIRASLIRALPEQESEIIQYRLIEMIKQTKEKSSLPYLEEMKKRPGLSVPLQNEIDQTIELINS